MRRLQRRGAQQPSESEVGAEKNRAQRFQIAVFSRTVVHTSKNNRQQRDSLQKVYWA